MRSIVILFRTSWKFHELHRGYTTSFRTVAATICYDVQRSRPYVHSRSQPLSMNIDSSQQFTENHRCFCLTSQLVSTAMASAIPGSSIFGYVPPQKGSIANFYSGSSPGKENPHRNVSHPEDTDIPSPDTEKTIAFEDETIMNTASQLAEDFISYKTDITAVKPSNKYAETLRRVGDEIDIKYNISLKGITDRLQFSPEKHGYDAYRSCLDSMFDEGQVNWGRIATVYVFSARLAKHCKESDLVEYVEDIKDYTAKYVRSRLGKWIKQQGGWDAMNDAFKESDWKDKVAFNGLLMTGAVLTGLAALRLLMGK